MPDARVIIVVRLSKDTGVLRRRQVLTYCIEGGVPSARQETEEGLRLHLLLFHQAQARESRGLLLITVVRLSASIACAFLYSSGNV